MLFWILLLFWIPWHFVWQSWQGGAAYELNTFGVRYKFWIHLGNFESGIQSVEFDQVLAGILCLRGQGKVGGTTGGTEGEGGERDRGEPRMHTPV